MNTYRFTLERYRGLSTRHTCPQCGRKHTFTKYIDTENNNNYLSERVGKCNRLDKCGYHYTPKQYFTDNPWLREKRDFPFSQNIGKWENGKWEKPQLSSSPRQICTLPEGIALASEGGDSAHMQWIEGMYGTVAK